MSNNDSKYYRININTMNCGVSTMYCGISEGRHGYRVYATETILSEYTCEATVTKALNKCPVAVRWLNGLGEPYAYWLSRSIGDIKKFAVPLTLESLKKNLEAAGASMSFFPGDFYDTEVYIYIPRNNKTGKL